MVGEGLNKTTPKRLKSVDKFDDSGGDRVG